jgi:hypothetical protein
VARALSGASGLIVNPSHEASLSALWLPAHIVEAFALLPTDGTGLVVIDSWDDLLSEYLPEQSVPPISCPSHAGLEKILVQALRTFAHAIVVVIVDSSSRSGLVDPADGVVEVAIRGEYGVVAGSILVTKTGQGSDRRVPIGFHVEGGRVRWHVNR